jgi:hypothetical protein
MSASTNLAVLQSVPQRRSDKEILSALNVTCNLAYKLLQRSKYRRASKLAQEALRLMPRRLYHTTIGAELRILAFSAGAMGDYVYGPVRERRRKRQERSWRNSQKKAAAVVAFTPATAHLLLVPDRTEPEVQS